MRKKLMVLAASTAVLTAAALAGCSSQGESSGVSTAKETEVSGGADTADAANGTSAAGAGENGVPAGDKVVVQIAHGNGTTWPGHIALEHMKQILDEDPDSGITIEIMPNGVLGGDNEVVQQVMLGTVPATLFTGMGFWQGLDERIAIDEMPFFFSTKEEARAAYDGEFGDRCKEIIDATGVTVINFWESGFRHFTNNIRPINTPEDMKGIKFRSYQGEYRMQMFDTLGATAVPMALTEVFTALQQGTVDGQENPLAMIEANKFYEVQKYLSLSGHIYNTAVLVVNPAFWDALTPEQQEAFQNAAAEGSRYCRELMDAQDEELIAKFEEAGVVVNEVDKEAFKEVMQPIYDKYIESCGDELIRLGQQYMN